MMTRSGHVDSFTRDNLPPAEQWPQLLLDRPEFRYPERLNCAVTFVDDQVAAGRGDRPCILAPEMSWTYAELKDHVDRIARTLVESHGLVPGNRVLLRAPNTPLMVATTLAVIRAGGVVVATMPLMRARELVSVIEKAQIRLAVCDHRLVEALEAAQQAAPVLERIVPMGAGIPGSLEAQADAAAPGFPPCDTGSPGGFWRWTSGSPPDRAGCWATPRASDGRFPPTPWFTV
jgi:2-aminobenzoate-CoA ligase